jgi:hypothetical protein
MGSSSDYHENLIIEQTIRNATKHLALFTTNPNFETGAGGTEATGGSYARKTIAFNAASGGATANTSDIEWTVGTDVAAGTYTGWGVYDEASAGNMLFGDPNSANRVLSATGDKLRYAAGAITYAVT